MFCCLLGPHALTLLCLSVVVGAGKLSRLLQSSSVCATIAPTVGALQPCLCLVLRGPVSCDMCGVSWLDVCAVPLIGAAIGG